MSVVIMGVSGSGKSTVGRLLAADIAIPFVDADDLHSAENKAKMAAGKPLTDGDRAPWLKMVGQVLAERAVVVACSALKHRYRDTLRQEAPGCRFVYLAGSEDLLAARLRARSQHFMPAALLDSQLRALEPPGAAEGALTLSIDAAPAAVVERIIQWLDGGR